MSQEMTALTGEVWAISPREGDLYRDEIEAILAGLRERMPDKRFVMFSRPMDLVPLTGLDAAWREVEAALPNGWWFDYLMTDSDEPPRSWAALARKNRSDDEGWIEATGATPTAALLELVRLLKEGATK